MTPAPALARDHPALAGFALAYLIGFSAAAIAAGNTEGVVYLIAISLAFFGVVVVYAHVEIAPGVLWGLSIWACSIWRAVSFTSMGRCSTAFS